jgi:hypothetical protein
MDDERASAMMERLPRARVRIPYAPGTSRVPCPPRGRLRLVRSPDRPRPARSWCERALNSPHLFCGGFMRRPIVEIGLIGQRGNFAPMTWRGASQSVNKFNDLRTRTATSVTNLQHTVKKGAEAGRSQIDVQRVEYKIPCEDV